jgi:nitroimidazol reductase NimA-like FMN-containing flavoprotein (pyridoxamine 5'-phosphate oxidase superfamily)
MRTTTGSPAVPAPSLPTHADRPQSPTSGLVALSHRASLQLLASHEVGRVVYTDGGLPAVTPVNFVYDEDHVFIRTTPVSQLVRKVPKTIVAFEVDEVDRKARSGWSVVITGPCEIVTDPERLAHVATLGVEPWAAGDRNVVLQISAAIVTGYRIARGDETGGGR